MSDLMTFPNTVEEFMEQYKIVDTEHVYTNGVEMVPIFRMQQWFDHVHNADAAPVVHAHRVHCHSAGGGTHWLACSECQNPIDHADKYCRNCGAIMDDWG